MQIQDPGWKKFESGIRGWRKLVSGINIPDLQHWSKGTLFPSQIPAGLEKTRVFLKKTQPSGFLHKNSVSKRKVYIIFLKN
jgi:hypothetical protein